MKTGEGDLMTSDPNGSINRIDSASGRKLNFFMDMKASKAEPPSTYELRPAELNEMVTMRVRFPISASKSFATSNVKNYMVRSYTTLAWCRHLESDARQLPLHTTVKFRTPKAFRSRGCPRAR